MIVQIMGGCPMEFLLMLTYRGNTAAQDDRHRGTCSQLFVRGCPSSWRAVWPPTMLPTLSETFVLLPSMWRAALRIYLDKRIRPSSPGSFTRYAALRTQ